MKEYWEYLEDDVDLLCRTLDELMSYAWFQLEATPEQKQHIRDTLELCRRDK